jgi:hypothetical protein
LKCAAVLDLTERWNASGQRDHPALLKALEAVAGNRGKLSAQRLGNFLGQMRGRRIDGLWFDTAPQSHGTSRWATHDQGARLMIPSHLKHLEDLKDLFQMGGLGIVRVCVTLQGRYWK